MSDGILERLVRRGRRIVRNPAFVRRDEGLWMLALGILVAVAPVILGIVVLVGTQNMDGRLSDATGTGHRLSSGQVDDSLTVDLIALQQDETTLFQSHLNYGQSAGDDPRADFRRVEADLATETGQIADAAKVRDDATLISGELPTYMGLEATALADNQQGLPVGTAYLRDASNYLRQQMLPKASEIRGVEQDRLRSDTGQAAGFPWWLIVVFVLVLGCLVFTHEVLARRTHRRLNRGLLIACVTVFAMGAGAITMTLLSVHRVDVGVRPHADVAINLTKAQDDVNRVELDDELTISDRDEDCRTASTAKPTYPVVCANEQDAQAYLSDPRLLAGRLDAVRQQLGPGAQSTRKRWLTAESQLPTLQNLAEQAAGKHGEPRYEEAFVQSELKPYTDPAAAASTKGYFDSLHTSVADASRQEWSGYAVGVREAREGLGVLAVAGLVLGVAAGVAAGLGCRPRVAEYWSRGGSAA